MPRTFAIFRLTLSSFHVNFSVRSKGCLYSAFRGRIPYCRSIDSMYAAAMRELFSPALRPIIQSEARKPMWALAASTVMVFMADFIAAFTFFDFGE